MVELTGVDYAVMVIIGLSILLGVMRGFVREALSLMTWIVAIAVSVFYCEDLSNQFSMIPVHGVRLLIAFLLIALVVLIIGSIINHLIGKLIKTTHFSLPDRIVGILFGFARGIFIIAISILIIKPTSIDDIPSWKGSIFIHNIEPMAFWLQARFPKEMLDEYLHPYEKDKEHQEREKREATKVEKPAD